MRRATGAYRQSVGRNNARWETFLRREAAVSAGIGLVLLVIWTADGGGYFWPAWVWLVLAVPLAVQAAVRHGLGVPPGRRALTLHGDLTGVIAAALLVIWFLAGAGPASFWPFWPVWPVLVLSIVLAVHGAIRHAVAGTRERNLADRVEVLTRTRRGALDVQAAELRRIERDLHDGAQARLVSVGISLGLAEELAVSDPDSVPGLIAEARASTLIALEDLRTLMRGIQPPVLADRGLEGALRALALDLAVPAEVTGGTGGRGPAPVESALYFAACECLANVVKHSGARQARVDLGYSGGALRVTVSDDGSGGASLEGGSGLRGVARRLEAFDGRIAVTSPDGGPTVVRMEVPCERSSPRT